MMNFIKDKFLKSFIFKIVGILILVQIIVLIVLGLYNMNYFSSRIEKRFVSQIKVPGKLLLNNALRYGSVNDADIMEQFIGEDLEEALLIGVDRRVYYSMNSIYREKNIADINELEYIEILGEEIRETKIAKASSSKGNFYICITPIFSDSKKLLGYFYIKAGTDIIDKERRVIFVTFLFGSLFAIGVIVAIGLWFSNKFEKKIKYLINLLKDISEGGGDLTKRIEMESDDELGEIAHYYNMFAENLGKMIMKIQAMIGELASAFNQLSVSSEEISINTRNQSGQIDNIATTITQLGQSLDNTIENTEKMVKQAEESSNFAEKGKVINEKLKDSIFEVQESENIFAADLQNLHESSEVINRIIGVISDITVQTNLLALNAAIQAVKAGEQGKGFSVVADEVRILAEQTHDSTNEITEIIQDIRSKIEHVVEGVVTNVEMITRVTGEADNASNMNDKINNTSRKTLSLVEYADRMYKEQTDSINIIRKNITSINNASTETFHSIEEVSKTINVLNAGVEQLNKIVGKFTV